MKRRLWRALIMFSIGAAVVECYDAVSLGLLALGTLDAREPIELVDRDSVGNVITPAERAAAAEMLARADDLDYGELARLRVLRDHVLDNRPAFSVDNLGPGVLSDTIGLAESALRHG